MLFRKAFLDGIAAGKVTLAYRKWRRPSVKTGGTLLTPIGQIEIGRVEPVSTDKISTHEARKAGYASHQELLTELASTKEGQIYRIELRKVRPDPRLSLREKLPDKTNLQLLIQRLNRFDQASKSGPWTFPTLKVIDINPGVRAGDLSGLVGLEKEDFKLKVRKLKNLGLTESLGTGYRLSPRGLAVKAAFADVATLKE